MSFAPLLSAKFLQSTAKKKAPPIESQLMKLTYPLAMQPKYDGVRIVCHPLYGVAKRKLDKAENHDIREKLFKFAAFSIDGEVVIVDEDGETMAFQKAQSAVARHEGAYNFKYMVFDCFRDPNAGFWRRYCTLKAWFERYQGTGCTLAQLAPVQMARSYKTVLEYYERCLDEGHEGCMLRSIDGTYKHGRSTLREQILIKMKPVEDAEAEVTGFEEMLSNQNKMERNNLGHAKRGKSQAGMVPAGTLGKFLVRGVGGQFDGKEFAIGGGRGLTRQLRDAIWASRNTYLGKVITYEYQTIGVLDLPRCPIFKGFRGD